MAGNSSVYHPRNNPSARRADGLETTAARRRQGKSPQRPHDAERQGGHYVGHVQRHTSQADSHDPRDGLKIPAANPLGSPSNKPLCPRTINANAGLDFGTRFYLTAFADGKLKYTAGRYRPRVNELDCIGLIVLSHSTTRVQFGLGAAYNQARFRYRHIINGDHVNVALNGATYGLVVQYH